MKKKKPASKKTPAKQAAKKAAKKVAKKATPKAKKAPKKAPKAQAKKVAKKVAKKAIKKAVKKAAKKSPTKKAKKAAAKKPAAKTASKPAAKKPAAAKTSTTAKASTPKDHGDVIALPGRKLSVGSYGQPAATPDGDALQASLADAFDEVLPPKPRVGDPNKTLKLDVSTITAYASSNAAAATTKFDRSKLVAFDEQPTVKMDRAALQAAFVAGDPTEDLAQACAALTLDKKAEDVVILKVSDLTSYADYFVIAAAPSERQVMAIAHSVANELKKAGKGPLSTDGMDQGNWVIVDYGSVVVHVFLQSARRYYDLDGFWVDAPRIVVDEARGLGALEALR